ncbi:MAG: protein-disulfide reductase DsbD domain-containing protein [Planctomycetaceae bacterium]
MPIFSRVFRSVPALLLCTALFANADAAQKAAAPTPKLPDLLGQSDGFGEFRNAVVQVSAELKPARVKPGDTVTLSVTLVLPPGNHTYPQNAKSAIPTKIRVKNAAGLQPLGDGFTPTSPPKQKVDPETKETYAIFEGIVTWSRKFKVTDVKEAGVSVDGTIRYQICTENSCKPPKTQRFQAKAALAGASVAVQPAEPKNTSVTSAKVHPFSYSENPKRRGKLDPLKLKFELRPKNAKPGDEVTVSITAKLDKGWHAYALTHPKGGIGLPVIITVKSVNRLEPIGKGWRPRKAPEVKVETIDGERVVTQEHHGTVTWSRKFKVAKVVAPGTYGLSGRFRYQICQRACLPPKSVSFSLGDLNGAQPAPKAANDIDRTPFPKRAESEKESGGLLLYLLLAFAGGLILNVMPCVLPVLAIKVMTFAQQAGEDRRRILMLNVMYSIGVIAVFLLLATLAVGIATGGEKLGWGGLFRLSEFNIVMGAVVFAMGLSLLGVFEIPLPGFIGSNAGGQSEGPGAAFLTGIMATVLATPCSGPFLGVTFAWSVKQPADITYLVWGTMGLGMAFPYLMLGVFPRAIRFLPRPGEWMVRFKEISGFVLMGTTLWVIRTLDKSELVYALIILVSLGFSLWLLGKLSLPNAPSRRRWMVRGTALAIVLFACAAGSRVLESAGSSSFFTFLQRPDLLAVTAVLLGAALAWWPLQASWGDGFATVRGWTLRAIAASLFVGSGVGAYAATALAVELPWQPYSEARLNEELKRGNVVLIDFTADW